MEIVGIVSVIPFISVVSNQGIIQSNKYLATAYELLGATTNNQFIVYLGFFSLSALALNNFLSAMTIWLLYHFTFMRGHSISVRLLRSYLHQPYDFFLDRNTAELTKNLFTEVRRVVSGVLIPCITLFSRFVIVIFIISMLLVVDYKLALIVSLLLGGLYATVYLFFRDKIKIMGIRATETATRRNKVAIEALNGIKEIKIHGNESVFINEFSIPSRVYAKTEATNKLITGIPKYALDTISFGGVLLIIIYRKVV